MRRTSVNRRGRLSFLNSAGAAVGRATPLVAALVGIGFAVASLHGAEITDNFDDGNDAGWDHYDPIGAVLGQGQATWSFPAGAYRLQSIPSPNLTLVGPSRVGSQRSDLATANFLASVDLVGWDDTLSQAMGLVARTQTPGPGTTKGYVFGYVSGAGKYAQIVRVNNERTSSISGSPPFPIALDPSRQYRLLFQGRGSRLEGRIYALPNTTEPIATLIADDSTFAEGTIGLLAFSGNSRVSESVDVTFDNFYGIDVAPPVLEYRDLGFGLIELLWPGDARAFRLESAETLSTSATEWSAVDEGLIAYHADIDRYVYQIDASIGQKFHRLSLRRP